MSTINLYTELYSQIQNGRGITGDSTADLLLSFSNYLNKVQDRLETKTEEEALTNSTEDKPLSETDALAEKKELATQLYQQCLSLIGKAWSDDDESKNTLDILLTLSNTLQGYRATGDSSQLSAYLKTMNAGNSQLSTSISQFNSYT